MRTRAVVTVAMVALLAGGCFFYRSPRRTPQGAQAIGAKNSAPAKVEADYTPNLETIDFAVRVHADAEFRAHTPLWKDQIKNRFHRINAYLVPSVGVRLVIEDLRQWDRKADATDLEATLAELRAVDDGTGVEWVVGFVAPPVAVTTKIHHLGMAEAPGKHFLVRGMDDARGIKEIDQIFDRLTDKERLDLYTKLKAHRELVVFLHEWAHTLGALHSNDPEDFMYTQHAREMTGFAPPILKFLRLAVEARAPGAGPDERKVVAEYLETMDFEEWDEPTRKVLADYLRRGGRAEPTAPSDDDPIKDPILATVDDRPWADAVTLVGEARYAEAWKKLAELVELYPEQAAVQLLACQLAGHLPAEKKALAACETVIKLRPRDPTPLIAKATTLTTAGRRDEALAAAAAAHALLEARGEAAPMRLWNDLASVYQTLFAVTHAEAAAAYLASREREQVEKWAVSTRRWVGFPAGMSADEEGEYAELVMRANEILAADTIPRVRKLIAQGEKKWKKAPGLVALRCAVEAYDERWKPALALCEQAIAAHGDSFLARFWAGQAAYELGRKDDAAEHLEHLIMLEPELVAAWELLAQIYSGAKLDELKARFKKQLGRNL